MDSFDFSSLGQSSIDPVMNNYVDIKKYAIFADKILHLVNSSTERQLGNLDIYSLSQFITNSNISPSTFVTTLILVEKFQQLEPKPSLFSEITSTELLIVAAVTASKYLNDSDTDEALYNVDWAIEFDIELKNLNNLERRFLYALDWSLFVSRNDFSSFISRHLSGNASHHPRASSKPSAQNHLLKMLDRGFTKVRGRYHTQLLNITKWPMAKAVTVFAAAFLAVSQPPIAAQSREEDSKNIYTRVFETFYLPIWTKERNLSRLDSMDDQPNISYLSSCQFRPVCNLQLPRKSSFYTSSALSSSNMSAVSLNPIVGVG